MLARFSAASTTRTLVGSAKDRVLVKEEVHLADNAMRADLDALPTRLTRAGVQLHVLRLPAIASFYFHSTLDLRTASSTSSVAKPVAHYVARGKAKP